MNNFQTILIAIFFSFAVFAVLIFSGVIKTGSDSKLPQGKVVVWGTFPKASVNNLISNINSANSGLQIVYESKDSSTYQQDLVEAFANGNGPDLFIITHDMILRNDNFIYKIPYTTYPLKKFTETYIEGADLYLDGQNVLGLPLVVDPMVMYYNKDLLTNEGIVYPPKTWDELFTLNGTLTKRNNIGTIYQSMIALGQYNNINNVEDILATLFIQNNNPIIQREQNNSGYISTLSGMNSYTSVASSESIFNFFIGFSNPSNASYSWNRALPNSLDMFTSGKLAFYLGRASEIFNIQSINPNLSFDVTQIPQIKDSPTKRTSGEIYAAVINKKSTNISTAFSVANMLSTGENAKNFSISVSLPSSSKALLSEKPSDNPYLYTFFDSALITRSWTDPDKTKSNLIFEDLVESILSNNLSISGSISKAQGQFDLLLKK